MKSRSVHVCSGQREHGEPTALPPVRAGAPFGHPDRTQALPPINLFAAIEISKKNASNIEFFLPKLLPWRRST
jgi:hypothetical protein